MSQPERIEVLIDALRENYHAYKQRWIMGGAALAFIGIAGAIFIPQMRRQEREVQELYTKGFQAMIAGNFSQASMSFERAGGSGFRLAGLNDEASLYEATALFGLGRYDKAAELYQKFLDKNGKSDYAVAAAAGLGSTFEARMEWDKALAQYQEARAKYPDSYLDASLEYRIAMIQRRLGKTAEASAIYEKFKKREKEDLWFELARAHARLSVPASVPASPDPNAPAEKQEPSSTTSPLAPGPG